MLSFGSYPYGVSTHRVVGMTPRAPHLVALLLVAVACAAPSTQDSIAEGGVSSSTAVVAPSTLGQAESPPADLESPAPTETDPPPAETVAPPAGPPAPDFTLALGDGRSFTLSEEARPVYLVFWAEW